MLVPPVGTSPAEQSPQHVARNIGIGSLPTEMLSLTFASLVNIWARECFWELHEPQGQQWEWLAVTRVCCYWRKVAYDTPPLWRYIFLEDITWTTPEEAKLRLNRAGSTSLVIKRREPASLLRDGDVARCLSRKFAQIQHLSVSTSDVLFDIEDISLDSPILRGLSLSCDHRRRQRPLKVDRLANASLPRLHTLRAQRLPHHVLLAALRPTLVSLSVDGSATLRQPTQTWVRLLQSLPDLRYIDLSCAITRPTLDIPPPMASTIPLRQLISISLREEEQPDGTGIADLLYYLRIPPNARILLSSSREYSDLDALYVIKAATTRRQPHLFPDPSEESLLIASRTMDIAVRPPNPAMMGIGDCTTISLYTEGADFSTSPYLHSAPSQHEESPTSTTVISLRCRITVQHMCTVYPLEDVYKMRVRAKEVLDVVIFPTGALYQMRNARVLELELGPYHWAIEFCTQFSMPNTLTALEHLVVDAQPCDDDRAARVFFVPLITALRTRRNGSRVLRQLTLRYDPVLNNNLIRHQKEIADLRSNVEVLELSVI